MLYSIPADEKYDAMILLRAPGDKLFIVIVAASVKAPPKPSIVWAVELPTLKTYSLSIVEANDPDLLSKRAPALDVTTAFQYGIGFPGTGSAFSNVSQYVALQTQTIESWSNFLETHGASDDNIVCRQKHTEITFNRWYLVLKIILKSVQSRI